eukprot:m.186522 g.186522  ORF g.186522 m.186522 type:complete len:113 (+) comp32272_c3_seq2:1335-1673(+)
MNPSTSTSPIIVKKNNPTMRGKAPYLPAVAKLTTADMASVVTTNANTKAYERSIDFRCASATTHISACGLSTINSTSPRKFRDGRGPDMVDLRLSTFAMVINYKPTSTSTRK